MGREAQAVFKTTNITLTIAFHIAFRPFSSLLVPTHIDPVAVHVAVQKLDRVAGSYAAGRSCRFTGHEFAFGAMNSMNMTP